MPVLRNVYHSRQPGRLEKQRQAIYNDNAWPAWPTMSENISYRPNIESPNVYYHASSLSLQPTPQSDQYSHSCQQDHKPLISDSHPSATNTSYSPSPRGGYAGRRGPDHIPRPRNAFIIFRSSYISAGEGPQNQLSKQAGEVWKKMTDDEKEPYTLLADIELKKHREMYPNYVYSPRRGSTKMKGSRIKTKDTNEPTSSSTPLVSPKSTTLETASAAPPLRPLHAPAQVAVQKFLKTDLISSYPPHASPLRDDSLMRENLEIAYPESNPPVKMDIIVPKAGIWASGGTLIEEDDFVPTADIPELQLSPSEESQLKFDPSMRPSNLNVILEQFGLNYHNDSTALLAHLPPLPDVNGAASTEDVLPSCSRAPATSVPENSIESSTTANVVEPWQSSIAYLRAPQQRSPDVSSYPQTPSTANFPITPTSSNTPLFFSTDGNISDCYQQQFTNGLAAPQQPSYFTWSSEDVNTQDDPMSAGDMMLQDDYSFMSYLFELTSPLNDPFFGYAMY